MKRLSSVYRLINVLSIDIASGAVVSALFFGKLLNVTILPFALVALWLTVWIIYTADHLRDAKTIRHRASSDRHRFHQKHFKTLFVLMGIAIAADAGLMLFMRTLVFEWGLVLAAVVLVYFIIQRYLKIFKELFIAFLYTCGVLLPSVSVILVPILWYQEVVMIQFGLLAFTNLLIFSWFDAEDDLADHQESFATIAGKSFTSICIWTISVVNVLLGTVLIWTSRFYPEPVIIIIGMNIVLAVLFKAFDWVRHHNRYRLIGDAVFLLPVIYLL